MLRKAILEDIPQLLVIEQLTQIAPWSEEVFQRCFQVRHECFVLENQSTQVIAFLIMSSALTGESHILNICVHPDYQRMGHGKQLMSHAMDHAKMHGIDMVYLEVRRSNTKAIRLYDALGFVQIGERKNYYPALAGREDALVFAKDLG